MPIVINVFFDVGENRPFITTRFSHIDILVYVGAIIPFFATVIFSLLILRQNENLNKINKDLQAQNMRISQYSLTNTSFNYLTIKSIIITPKNSVTRSGGFKSKNKIILNYLDSNLPYDSTDNELEICFSSKSYSNFPIKEIEVEQLNLEFKINLENTVIPERFGTEMHNDSTIFPTIKKSTSDGYNFTMYFYIPSYHNTMSDVLNNINDLKISLSVSYINMLNVKIPLLHDLKLSKKGTTKRVSFEFEVDDEQIEFGEINFKEKK